VPDLLDVQEPHFDFPIKDSISLRIDYDFLPRSILPRFIIRQHKGILKDLRWRTGTVMSDDTFECIAVIRADQAAKRTYLSIAGKHRRLFDGYPRVIR